MREEKITTRRQTGARLRISAKPFYLIRSVPRWIRHRMNAKWRMWSAVQGIIFIRWRDNLCPDQGYFEFTLIVFPAWLCGTKRNRFPDIVPEKGGARTGFMPVLGRLMLGSLVRCGKERK
jgi:hypothetical protein